MEQVVSVFITRATFVNFKQQGRHKYAADPILSCAALAILGTVWCWFLRSLNHPSSAHFVFPPASRTLCPSCRQLRVLQLQAHQGVITCGSESPQRVTNEHPESVWRGRFQTEVLSQRRGSWSQSGCGSSGRQEPALAYWAASAGA